MCVCVFVYVETQTHTHTKDNSIHILKKGFCLIQTEILDVTLNYYMRDEVKMLTDTMG